MVLEGCVARWGRSGQEEKGKWEVERIGVCSGWQWGEFRASVVGLRYNLVHKAL